MINAVADVISVLFTIVILFGTLVLFGIFILWVAGKALGSNLKYLGIPALLVVLAIFSPRVYRWAKAKWQDRPARSQQREGEDLYEQTLNPETGEVDYVLVVR